MNVIEKIAWRKQNFIKYHFPFLWNKILYKKKFGKVVDFSHLRDINEKIQWLMFYTDTSLWTKLADKYAVRQYVKNRVGVDVLVPLLGKWDRVEDIDFDSLPDKFVIKPNNGSYDTIICRDKSKVSYDEIRGKMSYSLNHRFGYENAEPHYLYIKPCIIAEKLLESDGKEGLIDYKIWCFNGKPYSIFVCLNRNPETHHADFMSYDLNWNRCPESLSEPFRNNIECPKPMNLDKMLAIAAKLSEGFPQVRVDLYNIKGKIYFGEMTFTSNFGMMPYYTQQVLNDMGNQCILPERTFIEKVKTFIFRWFPII